MRKYRVLLTLLITAIACVILVSCSSGSPKGDSKKAMEAYYQYIVDGNFESAYEKLAEEVKNNVSKEDFILLNSLRRECYPLKGFKVEKIDNTSTVKDSVEFNVVQTINNARENKETNETYKRKVVASNNEWKVYQEIDLKQEIPDLYNYIGWMYLEGKGKDKNLNEAASTFNQAIKYNPDYARPYYGLAVVYQQQGRYDESINNANNFMDKTKSDQEKSAAYNVLGLGYWEKGQLKDAKDSFLRALEFDNSNEYAKNNLANLNK
ncbi:lipoprotein NlpI [Pelotomaculum sp. FP]|uniref:tetratricopeptide repeat protein n=1 Tax=Pelotomaculum sp. FP TaxID=261474 RepID=UPI001066DA8D|nr:tetratricopeptide repeat protein [Pelotomaculum sp. FP]TEB10599.1 lipoprotein NlpI [Pelotomaculum sp. FP]